MNVLIADPAKGVFLIRGQENPVPIPCGAQSPCMPAAGVGRLIVLSQISRDCHVLRRGDYRPEIRFPAPPGTSALCPSPCGRWLYLLGSDADTVHTVHLGTGQLHYAHPAGVFPRSMRLSQDGSLLLVAGGAENEATLFSAPELLPVAVVHTRHPCFAADFWQRGLVLVCAAEGEDIQTVVYTLPTGRRRPREILRLPGMPGALKVCPDGLTALISTPDGLMKIDLLTGDLQWNLPKAALCMGLDVAGGSLLLSDLPDGPVTLAPLSQPWPRRTLWPNGDAQACFI